MMKISMGYPEQAEEIQMMKGQNSGHPLDRISAVETKERLLWAKAQVQEVQISDEVYQYISDLVVKTTKRTGSSNRRKSARSTGLS
jgi:MoxR-like ATPase